MVLFRVTWRVSAGDRQRVFDSLRLLLEPTRAMAGCTECRASSDIDEPNTITYTEEWADREAMNTHLRGDRMKVLLSAVDLACEAPVLRIQTVSDTRGIEAIALLRSGMGRGSLRAGKTEKGDRT